MQAIAYKLSYAYISCKQKGKTKKNIFFMSDLYFQLNKTQLLNLENVKIKLLYKKCHVNNN